MPTVPSVTQRTFRRLAVVNRGEPAMRLIHAVRELNDERADDPIKVIALYTEPERSAMFVRHADEAYSLGPTARVDADGRRTGAYLDYANLERALRAVNADAVWPGWGFVAEHPAFSDLCAAMDIVFVGPSGDVMRKLGDKIQSKLMAEQAGVPVAPWSNGPVETIEEAREHAERIGFPLMIKAAAGGGGRGIRRVTEESELENALDTSRREAQDAFGDGTVFMEAMVGNAHHIEVQLIADGQGTAWAAGVRDCSCQRRHQKVVEESASPVLTPEQEEEVKEASRRLALESGYRNAGTVEFLYEPEHKRFSFMEVNARLQVEHPVTEAVTGLDLVKLQLHVAAGGKLEGEPPAPIGHAIEARLNAEDPAMGFAPTPGRVQLLDLASGPGIRIDRGIATGDVIPPDFDSMVAKVIAHGRTRDEAIARLRRALRESHGADRGRHDQPRVPARAARPPRVPRRRGRHQLAGPPRRVRRDGVLPRRRRRAAAGRDRARRRGDRPRARELLRLRPPRPPADRGRRSAAPSRSATAARPTASSSPSSRPAATAARWTARPSRPRSSA